MTKVCASTSSLLVWFSIESRFVEKKRKKKEGKKEIGFIIIYSSAAYIHSCPPTDKQGLQITEPGPGVQSPLRESLDRNKCAGDSEDALFSPADAHVYDSFIIPLPR